MLLTAKCRTARVLITLVVAVLIADFGRKDHGITPTRIRGTRSLSRAVRVQLTPPYHCVPGE